MNESERERKREIEKSSKEIQQQKNDQNLSLYSLCKIVKVNKKTH